MKKFLILVIVSTCMLLAVSSISYGQGVAPPSNTWQQSAMMKINNDAPCTTSPLVTLNYNRCTQAFPCHKPIDWKASEDPNFRTCVQQGKTQQNWVYYNLCSGKGKVKKVYFQTSLDNYVSGDEIGYLDNCDDPGVSALMQIQILKTYEPYRFDLTFIFPVKKTSNATSFEINVQARAVGNNALLAQTTSPYPAAGRGTGDMIETVMNLTIPVKAVRHRGGRILPEYNNITLIVKVQPKTGATNTTDFNPNNNVVQRNLQLVATTADKPHVVNKCTGPDGSKDNMSVSLRNIWVMGQSTLSLHDCGTTGGNEIKCDSNPVPGLGQRGVRWVQRPTTDRSYVLHWWCEGFANKKDNSPQGYYFRFNVKYDFVAIRIP